MTETITESFCERCGTRYAFEQEAERRRGQIGRVRVLTRGLKNYVANDGMPMGEAMAAAQHDEARTGVSRQLDAFHRTFNFCMSCRQYTCANCWNGKVGECLTCAPDLSREVLPAPFPDLPLAGPVDGDRMTPDEEAVPSAAWPTADIARATMAAAAAGAPTDAEPPIALEAPVAPEAVAEPEALVALEAPVATSSGADDALTATELEEIETALAVGHPVSEPPAAPRVAPETLGEATPGTAGEATPGTAGEATPETAGEATPPVVETAAVPGEPVDRVFTAQQQTRSLLRRFRPGQRPAAAGPDVAVVATAAALAPVDVAAEPALEPQPEPAAAPAPVEVLAEPEPEPATAPELAAESEPEPAVPSKQADAIEQPTWRIIAPEAPVTPAATWPDAPAWPSPEPGATQPGPVPGSTAAPWASRLATARPEPTSVWAASSQEVLGAPGPIAASKPGVPAVQACVSCGLSLSANARFCRRCGSRQA